MTRTPRPSKLPAEVHFANWVRYQSNRTQSFARVWTNILYDVRTLPKRGRDPALGVLITGMLLAAPGRGTVQVTAWKRHTSDPKRCVRLIEWWLGNGLLLEGALEGTLRAFDGLVAGISRASDGHQTGSSRAPDGHVAGVSRASRGGKPAQHDDLQITHSPQVVSSKGSKGRAKSPPIAGASNNWIAPVLAEWVEKHGGPPDSRVKGLLLTGLQPIYASGQTPAEMAERFACWLNLKDPAKHRYVEDFTSRYGDYDPVKLRDGAYALGLNP
jgi:hypothetical protein